MRNIVKIMTIQRKMMKQLLHKSTQKHNICRKNVLPVVEHKFIL